MGKHQEKDEKRQKGLALTKNYRIFADKYDIENDEVF